MRAGVVSLALLGATARGCLLRGTPTKDAAGDPGRSLMLPRMAAQASDLQQFEDTSELAGERRKISVSRFSQRQEGKKALRAACSDDSLFRACETRQGYGSALQLSDCLENGAGVSEECKQGLAAWKLLLVETAARRKAPIMAEPTEPVGIEWANTEIGEDWKELMAMANADAFGREHEVWPFHYESLSGRSHKPRHDSEDSSDDKHRHGHGHGHGHAPAERPPSHHGHGPPGRGPHPPAPPGRGPPPHGHGPPPPGRGPHEDAPRTTFSVLADWIFGDSSSSDSSSDSWMKASSSEDSPELAEGGRLAFPEPRDFRSSKGLLSETDRNALLAEKKASLHEKRMYRSRAEAHDEEMDWRAGGVHPNGAFHEHHQQRGDHLRFRNRLPEEYQDSLWFDEMEFNEGGDWVETLLAFFFCVGVVTLVFLPFLMLGRELRKLVLRARRSHGGNAAASFTASGSSPPAPSSSAFGGFADRRRENAVNAAAAADGYQALADDTDDDAIVVTGTPVNPPPSVNA